MLTLRLTNEEASLLMIAIDTALGEEPKNSQVRKLLTVIRTRLYSNRKVF